MNTSSVSVYVGNYADIIFGNGNFDLKWKGKQVPIDVIKRAMRMFKWHQMERRYDYIDKWMQFEENKEHGYIDAKYIRVGS